MKRSSVGLMVLTCGVMALSEHSNGTASPRGHRSSCSMVAYTLVAQDKPEAPAKGKQDGVNQAILANVRNYVDAFNRQNAKGILDLFTDDSEIIEVDGTVVRGLKELEAELKDSFAADPTAKISVDVTSVRLVSPDVAIEEGTATYYPDGKTLTAESQYQVTHVRKGDRWLMSHVKNFNRTILNPYDQLRDLEWLIGEWVDESEDALVETSYRWDSNKTFLLQDFTVRVQGQDALKGTQRIGWDPLGKQLKSWVFDSEGGYADSVWSSVDDRWVVNARGVTADGKLVTMTNRITPITKDRFRFESLDRVVGEERQPDVSTIVVRRPPTAAP